MGEAAEHRFFTDERIEEAKKILGQHTTCADGRREMGQRWGRTISERFLGYAFRDAGHAAPSTFLARPQADAAKHIADPVERRAAEDRQARVRREHSELVDRVRDLQDRIALHEKASAIQAPPRILPREKTSGIREMTPIVAASDWHVEEKVDAESVAFRNEYNLDIADRRIRRFFDAIIWKVEHHRASGKIAMRDLVLWLGGDLYSGYIHEELVENNLLSPTQAVAWLVPRLRDGIKTLLEVLRLERIVVPCSYGNHGRTTAKPRVSTGHANSFDLLLYGWVAESFKDDKRVTFEITASSHQYVEIYGETLHFHHGDQVKYMGGVGGLGIPLLKKIPMWDRVRPSALHIIGHHHTFRDFGRAISNGSLIGYNPYAQSIGAEFEEPKQAFLLWDKVRQKTDVAPLWVERSDQDVRPKRVNRKAA